MATLATSFCFKLSRAGLIIFVVIFCQVLGKYPWYPPISEKDIAGSMPAGQGIDKCVGVSLKAGPYLIG
jgi:hypothetical protein